MKMPELKPYEIRTFTGHLINVFNPNPDHIEMLDIAVGLSRKFRWSGMTKEPYSVAQHSIEVGFRLPLELQLEGFLHDAAEAYISDIPSPIKKFLPDYQVLENNLMEAIAKKFKLQWPFPAEIKKVDKEVLKLEYELLFVDKYNSSLRLPISSKAACDCFLMVAEAALFNHLYILNYAKH